MSMTSRPIAPLPVLFALLLGFLQPGLAQSEPADGARREAMELRVEELKQRLALTPEQEAQLAPLIEARNANLRKLRAGSGGDDSRRARMARLQQARKIQEEFNSMVAPILTREQQAEWGEIRKEVRAAAKERMRERRS
jgi:hypothetical protein